MPSTTPLTNLEVVTAIKTIAVTALTTHKTVVIPRQLLGFEDGATADLFRSEADAGRVNALFFWREAVLPNGQDISQLRSGPAPSFEPARVLLQSHFLVRAWVYRLRFYYQYETANDSANSQITFDAIVDTLNTAFAQKPKLGLDSYRIERHGELFWPSLALPLFGDLLIHEGQGQLVVIVHRPA